MIKKNAFAHFPDAEPACALRVLTIEDDPITTEEITVELRGRGFEVEDRMSDGNCWIRKSLQPGAYDAITTGPHAARTGRTEHRHAVCAPPKWIRLC